MRPAGAAGDPRPAGGQGAWPRTPCTQTSVASVNVSTQLGLGQDAQGSGCEFGQDLVGISEHSSSVVLLLASWAPGRAGLASPQSLLVRSTSLQLS